MRRWFSLLLTPAVLLSACGGSSNGGAGDTPASVQSVPEQSPPPATTTSVPPAQLPPLQPDLAVVRVLGLYSNGAAAIYPDIDLRIDHLFNLANAIAADSDVPVRFELTQIMATSYPDAYLITEALETLTFADHAAFADVETLRDQTGADLVTFFRPYANDGLCGYAWVGGYQTDGDFSNPAEAEFGYSVVAIDCSDYTLVHELGHNLGLVHSRREDPSGGSLPFGAGYGIDNDFVTIMASPTAFNAIRLPLFSSPHAICNGQPCGLDAADPTQGADAVLALRQVVDQVAAYRN